MIHNDPESRLGAPASNENTNFIGVIYLEHPNHTQENSRYTDILSSFSFTLTLLLIIYTPFIEMSGYISSEQKIYRIYGYGFLFLLQIFLILSRGWRRSLDIYNTTLVPFFIWAALSLLWTPHIDLTIKRLALVIVVYLGIFAGICDLSRQRALSILRYILVAVLIINFVAALALPDIGTHSVKESHLWRGLMAHKNIAAMLCAFTIILFAFDCRKVPAFARFSVVILSLVFLILTWSKTALIALPIALATGFTITLLAKPEPSSTAVAKTTYVTASLAMFTLVAMSFVALTIQNDVLLSLTDDTTALTTRGAIWRPMIQFYLENPFLGSGYGAYWDGSPTVISQEAKNARLWKDVDQGHNGYLDLMVQLGLPGLLLALYAAFVHPVRQLSEMIKVRPQTTALVTTLLIFTLIENFTETFLLADDAMGNGFFLIALAIAHNFILRSSSRSKAKSGDRPNDAVLMRERRQRRQQSSL